MKYSLVDEAYKRIKEELLSQKFSEGSKIPSENQLCKQLNVSRVVVREALSRLRNEKLIITYQGKGSYLANPNNFIRYQNTGVFDFETFRAVMDFRTGIESVAVKLAVQNADDKDLSAVKEIHKKMVNGEQDFNQLDYDFHYAIIKASKNVLLLNAYENCENLIKNALNATNSIEDGRAYAINLHGQIADALLKRDVKRVIMLTENNGEYNFARLQEIFKN